MMSTELIGHTISQLCQVVKELASGDSLGRVGLRAYHLVRALQQQERSVVKRQITSLAHISWEALHTGPWHAVAVAWREVHSLAAISETIQTLRDLEINPKDGLCTADSGLRRCLRRLDMALLVGGPRLAQLIHPLIEHVHETSTCVLGDAAGASAVSYPIPDGKCSPEKPPILFHHMERQPDTDTWQQECTAQYGHRCRWLEAIQAPGLMQFEERFMSKQQPVLLQGVADAWPAMHRWTKPGYLDVALGHRTLPVEVGSNYLDSGWGLTLMTFSEFTAAACSAQPRIPPTSTQHTAQATPAAAPAVPAREAGSNSDPAATATCSEAAAGGAPACAAADVLPEQRSYARGQEVSCAAALPAGSGAAPPSGSASGTLSPSQAARALGTLRGAAGHSSAAACEQDDPRGAPSAPRKRRRIFPDALARPAVCSGDGSANGMAPDGAAPVETLHRQPARGNGDAAEERLTPSAAHGIKDSAAAGAGAPHGAHTSMHAVEPGSQALLDGESVAEEDLPRTIRIESGASRDEEGPLTWETCTHTSTPEGTGGATAAAAALAAAASIGASPAEAIGTEAGEPKGRPRSMLYMAQHPLFEQVPALRCDIMVPEYCALGDGDIKSINAWIGPAGTVTPLHTDPHHNLFVQVVGCKYIQIYPPEDTPFMYPHEAGLTTNSSRVDARDPDTANFPLFARTRGYQCIIRPGEALYLPPGWWHYVESLTPSVSVSFWWA
eukprot:jgi/Ulvmu1/6506/UM003_0139.1